MIDEGFIRRTYRTTVIVWAFTVISLAALRLWFPMIGFTAGAALSLFGVATLEKIVRRTFVPGATKSAKNLAKFGALKILVIAAIISGVVMLRRFDVIAAFCGGVILTQAVMFLKVLGMSLVERVNR